MNLAEVDRLSILFRKYVEAEIRHAVERQEALMRKVGSIDSQDEDKFKLAAINAAIWQRNDLLRELAKEEGHTKYEMAGKLAFELLTLNDWRSKIIGEIKF